MKSFPALGLLLITRSIYFLLEANRKGSILFYLHSSSLVSTLCHQKSVQTTSTGNSGVVGIATPKTQGANVLTSSFLASLANRLNASEHIQVIAYFEADYFHYFAFQFFGYTLAQYLHFICHSPALFVDTPPLFPHLSAPISFFQITYDDLVFTLQDVCFTALGDYSYPCYRMTSLDCFQEGGHSFDKKAASAWRTMFTVSAQDTGIASAKVSFRLPSLSFFLTTWVCSLI